MLIHVTKDQKIKKHVHTSFFTKLSWELTLVITRNTPPSSKYRIFSNPPPPQFIVPGVLNHYGAKARVISLN